MLHQLCALVTRPPLTPLPLWPKLGGAGGHTSETTWNGKFDGTFFPLSAEPVEFRIRILTSLLQAAARPPKAGSQGIYTFIFAHEDHCSWIFYSVKRLRCLKAAVPRLRLIKTVMFLGQRKHTPHPQQSQNHNWVTDPCSVKRPWNPRTLYWFKRKCSPPRTPPLLPLQRAVATVFLERKYLLFLLLLPTTPPMCPLATGSSSAGHGRRANRGTLSA